MDPLGIRLKPLFDQVTLLSMRRDLLSRLWPEESRIRDLVIEAVKAVRTFSERDPRFTLAVDFLDNVFALIRRPRELVDFCAALATESDRQWLLDRFVMSKAADGDVIAEMVADREAFARLPQRGPWIGHAFTRRVAILLEDHPERKFEIEDLIPLGIANDRVSARSLLGAAFDEDRLTDLSVARLLDFFPTDSYLQRAIEKRRTGSG